MIRTFLLSGTASVLSLLLYAVFVATVGVGAGTDAFFAALAVAQTLAGLLYAPYENFAQRFALDHRRRGAEAVAPLVVSYVALSAVVLVPYYRWGAPLLGPLFGAAYTSDPALWRHHFDVLGLLVPLNGVVAMLQVCCQARERYDLPKVGLVVGRSTAIGLFWAAGAARLRVISVALVAGQIIATIVAVWGGGSWRVPVATMVRDVRAVLSEWLQVNRWTVMLRTDQLLERVLAAHVKSGFLSLFSLGWSAVVHLVEAFHSAFAVPDSNRYHAAEPRGRAGGLRALLTGPYRRSTRAALILTGGTALLGTVIAVAGLVAGWTPGGVGPGELALLVGTLVVATLAIAVGKQVGGAYTIQHRAVELARGLTLVYLLFAGPRVFLTWRGAALGFCVGLVAYYGGQVLVLGRRV